MAGLKKGSARDSHVLGALCLALL